MFSSFVHSALAWCLRHLIATVHVAQLDRVCRAELATRAEYAISGGKPPWQWDPRFVVLAVVLLHLLALTLFRFPLSAFSVF